MTLSVAKGPFSSSGTSFGFEVQPTVNVPQNNEASLLAGNMSMAFEDQNPNAFQPTPNQKSMCQEPVNFQSFYNANSPHYFFGNSVANSAQYFLGNIIANPPQYQNGLWPNRASPNGYWMPTESYNDIPQSHGSWHPVGYERILDFYEDKHLLGSNTVWEMHEHSIYNNNSNIHNFQNNGRPEGDMTVYMEESNGGDKASTSGCETQSPTVNVAQNNEAANSMLGDSNTEVQNQPTPNQRSICQEPGNLQSFRNGNRLINEEDLSWIDSVESLF